MRIVAARALAMPLGRRRVLLLMTTGARPRLWARAMMSGLSVAVAAARVARERRDSSHLLGVTAPALLRGATLDDKLMSRMTAAAVDAARVQRAVPARLIVTA